MHAASCARVRWLIAGAALAGAGCYDFSLPADPAATAATTGSGGSSTTSAATSVSVVTAKTGSGGAGGGGAGGTEACNAPDDCDDPGACLSPTCVDHACERTFDNEGDACNLPGGGDGLCSGQGECVQCLSEGDCPVPSDCQIAVCDGTCGVEGAEDGTVCDGGECLAGDCDIDPLCGNGVVDSPNETDEDCGGTCPRCANDLSCVEGTDCQSGFCDPDDSTCRECGDNDDCPSEQWCDLTDGRGTCTDDKDGGDCDDAAECSSGFCADGFCCESACDGICEACSALGSCEAADEGTDPDADCDSGGAGSECGTGQCNAAKACEPRGAGMSGSPECPGNLLCAGEAVTCLANCVDDTSCAGKQFCDNGPVTGNTLSCLDDLSGGQPCTRDTQCLSESCGGAADGKCDA